MNFPVALNGPCPYLVYDTFVYLVTIFVMSRCSRLNILDDYAEAKRSQYV